MTLEPEAIAPLYQHADEWYKELGADSTCEVMLYYAGDVGAGFSNALASRLELLLEEKVDNRQALKRFFSAFIEAIQNIRIHGSSDAEGRVHCGLVIYRLDRALCATFMNVVSMAQGKMLARRYSEINALSPEELKKRYLDTLKGGEISEKGGAGMGIITIVMRSRQPSAFELMHVNTTHCIFKSTLCVSLI